MIKKKKERKKQFKKINQNVLLLVVVSCSSSSHICIYTHSFHHMNVQSHSPPDNIVCLLAEYLVKYILIISYVHIFQHFSLSVTWLLLPCCSSLCSSLRLAAESPESVSHTHTPQTQTHTHTPFPEHTVGCLLHLIHCSPIMLHFICYTENELDVF